MFRAEAQIETIRACGKDGNTLQMSLIEGDAARKGVAFHKGYLAREGWRDVDVLFVPTRNEYRGDVSVQLQYRCIRAS